MNQIIPNPFDKNSTLAGVAKKGELIQEGLTLRGFIKRIIFPIIIGIVLAVFFKIPVSIIAILVVVEIIITLIGEYFKIRKIQAIYKIESQDNAQSYRKIQIVSQYWELVQSTFALVADFVVVILIFILLSNQIDQLSRIILEQMPVSSYYIKYTILIFVLIRALNFVSSLLKYHWIKKMKESDNFAEVHQEAAVIEGKLELFESWNFIPYIVILLYVYAELPLEPV